MAITKNGIYYPDDYSSVADVPGDMKKMADSIDENQETQNKNIENLQEKDTTQDELIEKLQQENENIKNALINEETEQAKSIHVEDASTVSAQLSVEGNAEQEVTETENNVFNGNLEVGSWDYNTGEKTTAVNAVRSVDYIDVEGLSQISIVAQNEINFTDIGVRYYSANKEYIGRTSINDITNAVSTTINNNLDDTKTVKYMTFNLVGTTDTNTKIAINKNVDLEWHDFIPNSPSPNYPSKVKCLGSNKNLYPGWEIGSINATTGKPYLDNHYIRSIDFIPVFLNKDYTIKIYNLENINQLNTAIRMYDNNKEYLESQHLGNIDERSMSFILTNSEVRYIKLVHLNTSAIPDTAKVDIKLEEGDKATSYSPYGQGSTEIVRINSNFLNTENINKTIFGVNVVSNTDKSLKIAGTANADGYGGLLSNIDLPFVLKKGTKIYLLFGKDNKLLKDTNVKPFLWFYSSDNTLAGTLNSSGYSVTISEDATKLTFGIEKIESGKTYNENIFIVLSTEEVTDYIKHEQTNDILNIQQEMLNGDYFVKEQDGWKEFHNWNKKELTGNENIALEGTYNGIAQFCIKDITNAKWNNDRYTINAYSNYFKAVAFTDSWTKDEVVTITGGKTVRFMSSKYTTVAEFKQFLQEKYTEGNPVVVYYKLETLEELSCTEEQSTILDKLNELDMFDGTNNMFTTEDIALLKLNYIADTKTYIDNQINERLSNIENQIVNLSGGN